MTRTLLIHGLMVVHVVSLSLWFGGLFGYVMIVWPAIMKESDGEFPRALLARIAMLTAPWIYLAMATALLTFVAMWAIGGVNLAGALLAAYGIVLAALVANNMYGTVVAWPRIMLLPRSRATREWFWFRVRMSVSLLVGLTLYSAAVIYNVTSGGTAGG